MSSYEKRTVTFRTAESNGTCHTINAAELSTEVVGDLTLMEPGDFMVLHPDGSGAIIRTGASGSD